MKKMWVKRENIYHKPFYKQKFKMSLLGVVLMGIIFFAYQIFYMSQLQFSTSPFTKLVTTEKYLNLVNSLANNKSTEITPRKKIIRGIRLRDYDLYNPSVNTIFQCIKSGKEIPMDRVNDDYCDCPEDGSDEPQNNACPNGVFYCQYQKRYLTGHGQDVSIPSNRINDGVCDCCDGSDEWLSKNEKGDIIKCPNSCT